MVTMMRPSRKQGGSGVRQCLTTSDKRPAERMEYWQEVVCRKYVSASAVTDLDNEDFSASLTSRELGPLTSRSLRRRCISGRASPRMCATTRQEVFIVSLIRSGGGELTPTRPHRAPRRRAISRSTIPARRSIMRSHASTHLIKIPKALLQAKLGDARDVVACKIGRGDPLSAILNDLIADAARLWSCPTTPARSPQNGLSAAIVDLARLRVRSAA